MLTEVSNAQCPLKILRNQFDYRTLLLSPRQELVVTRSADSALSSPGGRLLPPPSPDADGRYSYLRRIPPQG